MTVPILIPAFEPDEKLLGLLDELNRANLGPVVVVNDGSKGKEQERIFEGVAERGVVLLTHAVNMGKGRALKTAFNYCLNEYEDLVGVITADSDGQHTTEDIEKCKKALIEACSKKKDDTNKNSLCNADTNNGNSNDEQCS